MKIGLETHVQLNSQSKMFCGCQNSVNLKEEREPNTLVCPTCLGLPGSKPVANRAITSMAVKIALALNCKVAEKMFFSRKTYFYPDMSKNYQITQYEMPLGSGGFVDITVDGARKRIKIKRVHVEEDPAKIVHIGGLGGKYTLIDYNRSGIPLIEIVTEPDFESPKEARAYLTKMITILEYLGVYDSASQAVIKSDANISLQSGVERQLEAHGSVGFSKWTQPVEGARVEVKNITGAKDVEEALEYEYVRQKSLLIRGVSVSRETRTWNPEIRTTQDLRGKEEEEEYGYIFDPDLTVIDIPVKLSDSLKKKLPELPDQKFQRFTSKYGLQNKIAESLVSDMEMAGLFDFCARHVNPKVAGAWIAGDLKKTLNWNGLTLSSSGLKKEWIAALLTMFEKGKLTDRNVEIAIRKMVEENLPPQEIVKKYGLQKSDKADVENILKTIVEVNKKAADDYKGGEEKALNFLVGIAMKETKGQVEANLIREKLLLLLRFAG